MKNFTFFICIALSAVFFSSCSNYRKLLIDEVVLKDGNSHTGTIMNIDSASLKLKKIDESISIIPWSAIDTVQGKKLRTLWLGLNVGYYKTPYFSVFRNEAIIGRSLGMEYKVGIATRGVKLYYLNLGIYPAKPYAISKFGFGYQHYLGRGNYYTKKNNFFVGGEANLMSVKYNNGTQTTLEPFTGFERKCNERIRVHFKLGLQINLANKNNQTGVNASIGIHFMKRNFKKYYELLNKEHILPRK